jgi:hypothetical protein
VALGLAAALWWGAGCRKPTEAERLAKFRSSLKVRAYRTATRTSVALAVTEFNKRAAQPLGEVEAHAALGVLLLVAKRPELAYVEGELVGASAAPYARLYQLGMEAYALQELGFPEHGQASCAALKQHLAELQGTSAPSAALQGKAALLVVVLVGLYEEDPALTQVGATGLAALAQVDYLPALVGLLAEARAGHPLAALERLRELQRSQRFRDHELALLDEVRRLLEATPEGQPVAKSVVELVVAELAERVLRDSLSAEEWALLRGRLGSLLQGTGGEDPSGEAAWTPATAGNVTEWTPDAGSPRP